MMKEYIFDYINEAEKHISLLNKKEAQEIFDFIRVFYNKISEIPASEERFYHQLNEFMDSVYDLVHEGLTKFNFKNGDPAANSKNHPVSIVWWLNGEISSCIYRWPCNCDHHASAADRKKAILNSTSLLHSLMKRYHEDSNEINEDDLADQYYGR